MNELMKKRDVIRKCMREIKDYLPNSFQGALIEEASYWDEKGEVNALSLSFQDDGPDLKFNMDQFYESYREIMMSNPLFGSENVLKDGMSHLAKAIEEAYEDARTMRIPEFSPENYEKIKERLVISLFGTEGKEQFLKDKPHTLVGTDLAILYKLELEQGGDVSRRITIDNSMVEKLGITREQFHEDALGASMKNSPIKITGLLASMLPEDEIHGDPFTEDQIVVTTKDSICGAAALFYPGVQEMIAEKMKESFYVIPSSIHEVILIKDSFGFDAKTLEKMIREANEVAVAPKDRLSDHAYHYDAKEGLFERADVFEERTHKMDLSAVRETSDLVM